MDTFFTVTAIVLVAIILIPSYRVVLGPTLFDRLLAMGAMGGKTIGLVCIVGLVYGRLDIFIDIALGYAVLNFIAAIAVAKYFKPPGKSS